MRNETIARQLNHRTIRAFTDQPVADATMATLFAVMNRTATSTGMQAYSVIRVQDPVKRQALAAICRQTYIASVPQLAVFLVDVYRNRRIAASLGCHHPAARDMDRFFQGFTDAALAAQNLVVAAESLGLGTLFFGSLLNDPDQVIQLLDLPELTFPVVGVGLGYPAQNPQLKPRLPLNLKIFTDRYDTSEPDPNLIEAYDREMQAYYDLRDNGRRSDTFSRQVVTRLTQSLDKRARILQSVKRQGFDLGLGS